VFVYLLQVSGKTIQVHLKSESLLSKTDLTVQSLVSKDSSFVDASEGLDNNPFTPVRGRALSDLMTSPTEKHPSGLPVLEPIKIRSTENAEDESSESEPEDEANYEVTNDSDSEPEADREIRKTGDEDESDGKKVSFESLKL